jgi:hypothetical protein
MNRLPPPRRANNSPPLRVAEIAKPLSARFPQLPPSRQREREKVAYARDPGRRLSQNARGDRAEAHPECGDEGPALDHSGLCLLATPNIISVQRSW